MSDFKTRSNSAQILLIVLIILAVISIISLAVTINTQRDITEQTQTKQYEQYYVLSEKMLISMQKELSTNPLDTRITSRTIGQDTGTTITSDSCGYSDSLNMKCVFSNIDSSVINPNSDEIIQLTMMVQDSNSITDYYLEKDKDLLIDLETLKGVIGDITLQWTESRIHRPVGWLLTYDYQAASPIPPIYKSLKRAFGPEGAFSEVPGNEPNCIQILSGSNSATISLSGCIGFGTPLFIRIKPINSSTTISLSIAENTIPLMRTITSISTSSTQGSSMEQNPSVMLQTNYLLTSKPSPLLNYVLRSEDAEGIIKQ